MNKHDFTYYTIQWHFIIMCTVFAFNKIKDCLLILPHKHSNWIFFSSMLPSCLFIFTAAPVHYYI